MTILTMTLKTRWFDEVASGAKVIEYRDVTSYWKPRIEGRTYDAIRFRNGYSQGVPELVVEYLGWSFVEHGGRRCYALRLGRIIEFRYMKSDTPHSRSGNHTRAAGQNPPSASPDRAGKTQSA